MNWHGILWDSIDQTMCTHPSIGPQWSSRNLVKVLQRRDPVVFSRLNASTVEGWIDRSGPKPCWTERALAMAQDGNHQGHAKGGRQGILVCNLC
jgi:hypothetical protein